MVTHQQEFRYETCWYDVISYEILNIYSNSAWNYNSAVKSDAIDWNRSLVWLHMKMTIDNSSVLEVWNSRIKDSCQIGIVAHSIQKRTK